MTTANNSIIIVAIPQNSTPVVWGVSDESELFKKVSYTYEKYNLEAAEGIFGKGEIPEDFIKIIENDGYAVVISNSDDYSVLSIKDAPTEREFVESVISRDLKSCLFLTTQEAQDLINDTTGSHSEDIKERVRSTLSYL